MLQGLCKSSGPPEVPSHRGGLQDIPCGEHLAGWHTSWNVEFHFEDEESLLTGQSKIHHTHIWKLCIALDIFLAQKWFHIAVFLGAFYHRVRTGCLRWVPSTGWVLSLCCRILSFGLLESVALGWDAKKNDALLAKPGVPRSTASRGRSVYLAGPLWGSPGLHLLSCPNHSEGNWISWRPNTQEKEKKNPVEQWKREETHGRLREGPREVQCSVWMGILGSFPQLQGTSEGWELPSKEEIEESKASRFDWKIPKVYSFNGVCIILNFPVEPAYK
jgi:hypothetical protein